MKKEEKTVKGGKNGNCGKPLKIGNPLRKLKNKKKRKLLK